MTNEIKLNFIDRSNDHNNSDIVFYQKNVATDYDSLSVAWKVIRNCGVGCNHPFVYPMEMQVSASDSWGNYMPMLTATNGNLYHVTRAPSGDELSYKGWCKSLCRSPNLTPGPRAGAFRCNVRLR